MTVTTTGITFSIFDPRLAKQLRFAGITNETIIKANNNNGNNKIKINNLFYFLAHLKAGKPLIRFLFHCVVRVIVERIQRLTALLYSL